MSALIKAALKGREPLIYARVSTTEQKGTLQAQVDSVMKDLQGFGVRRKPRIWVEQVSGTKRLRDRPELAALIDYASKKPGKVAIVVRDTQRFSRSPWIVGALYDPLRELDIPLVSMEAGGKVASTDKVPQVEGDLLMPILSAVGGHEVSLRTEQTLKGLAAAKAKGIHLGMPLNVYPKDPLNPYRELDRLQPLIVKGDLSGSAASRRLDKSTSWVRKTLKRLDENQALGDEGFEQWLQTIDRLREMEQKHGPGIGKRATKAMKAVRRQTAGYLANPSKWPVPTDAELADYFANWRQYQPKRSK